NSRLDCEVRRDFARELSPVLAFKLAVHGNQSAHVISPSLDPPKCFRKIPGRLRRSAARIFLAARASAPPRLRAARAPARPLHIGGAPSEAGLARSWTDSPTLSRPA